MPHRFGKDFHKSILDNLSDGVYTVDPDRTITYWNGGAQEIAGYGADEIVGRPCYANILAHVDADGNQLCESQCPLAATIADGERREMTIWLRHRTGYRKPVRVRTTPIRSDEGEIVGAAEIFSDASALRLVEPDGTVRRDPLTDPLTGLPTRRYLDVALDVRLERLARDGTGFGLLIVSVDFFAAMRDELGEEYADAVLRGVGSTLQGAVSGGEVATRGEGEQMIVLVDARDPEHLLRTAQRLRVLVSMSEVRHDGLSMHVYVSIGAALASPDDTVDTLLERASEALAKARIAGSAQAVVFELEPNRTEGAA